MIDTLTIVIESEQTVVRTNRGKQMFMYKMKNATSGKLPMMSAIFFALRRFIPAL